MYPSMPPPTPPKPGGGGRMMGGMSMPPPTPPKPGGGGMGGMPPPPPAPGGGGMGGMPPPPPAPGGGMMGGRPPAPGRATMVPPPPGGGGNPMMGRGSVPLPPPNGGAPGGGGNPMMGRGSVPLPPPSGGAPGGGGNPMMGRGSVPLPPPSGGAPGGGGNPMMGRGSVPLPPPSGGAPGGGGNPMMGRGSVPLPPPSGGAPGGGGNPMMGRGSVPLPPPSGGAPGGGGNPMMGRGSVPLAPPNQQAAGPVPDLGSVAKEQLPAASLYLPQGNPIPAAPPMPGQPGAAAPGSGGGGMGGGMGGGGMGGGGPSDPGATPGDEYEKVDGQWVRKGGQDTPAEKEYKGGFAGSGPPIAIQNNWDKTESGRWKVESTRPNAKDYKGKRSEEPQINAVNKFHFDGRVGGIPSTPQMTYLQRQRQTGRMISVVNRRAKDRDPQPCSEYEVDTEAESFGDCYCGWPKVDHLKRQTRLNVPQLRQARRERTPQQENKRGTVRPRTNRACGDYELDPNGKNFGDCFCGFAKADHIVKQQGLAIPQLKPARNRVVQSRRAPAASSATQNSRFVSKRTTRQAGASRATRRETQSRRTTRKPEPRAAAPTLPKRPTEATEGSYPPTLPRRPTEATQASSGSRGTRRVTKASRSVAASRRTTRAPESRRVTANDPRRFLKADRPCEEFELDTTRSHGECYFCGYPKQDHVAKNNMLSVPVLRSPQARGQYTQTGRFVASPGRRLPPQSRRPMSYGAVSRVKTVGSRAIQRFTSKKQSNYDYYK